jgi:sugar-specific transcriptional regulator TrmB
MNSSKNFDNVQVITDLQRLGLTSNEAAVYVALLELGEVGSSKIIAKTVLHGQYVYQALLKLEEKGLAQHIIRNGRKKFSAKSPNVLARLIEQQKRLADEVADKLRSMIVLPQEQQFEVYQGVDSYVSHEFDLLERAMLGATLLVIGGTGDQFIKTMGMRISEYDRLRQKKKISVRYIGSEDQREMLKKTHGIRQAFEFRLLPGLFTGLVNTNIWPDSVGFNIYGEPVSRVTISSRVIAESYMQFFETLWKLGKPLQII